MEPIHPTTSGSSEPHAPSYKMKEGERANEGPTHDNEQQKLEKTSQNKKAQKQDHLASIRESHGDLSGMTEENLANYTGLLVAYMRAAETKRDDAIIHDPYAELLAGDAGGAILQMFSKWSLSMTTFSDFIALRTRSIDEALIHRPKSIHQVVILGAGLDSRAYRMKTLSDCLVIEVDSSATMMKRKQKVLDDAGVHVLAKQHHVIIADLENDMWSTELIAKGFNPKEATFWLLEGLLYYMSYDSNVRLVKTIDALSAPHSQLWADISGFPHGSGSTNEAESFFTTHVMKYSENDPANGVVALLKWSMEIQSSTDEPHGLYGREWKLLTVFSNDKGEEEVVPSFFIKATKTQAHPSEEPLL